MALLPTRNAVQKSYDAVAADYAALTADELRQKPADARLLDKFAAALAGGGRCLDLGCGPGHLTAYLTQHGVETEGLDISRGMIKQARKRYPGLTFTQGDLWKMKYPDNCFAAVVAKDLLQHVPADSLQDFFLEVRRIIEPNGALLIGFEGGIGAERPDTWLGHPVKLTFCFHRLVNVLVQMQQAGFQQVGTYRRQPYPGIERDQARIWILAESLPGVPPARKRQSL
ncbi:MAG: class I SAM-dependent methyltransferase [Halieaceae bacterium]|jgi:ubiquinone/menaquinone biosynthesis C-methylase UbiE|nr:class I SAM-dependent methyltransferase [Halieaceae bacterium]